MSRPSENSKVLVVLERSVLTGALTGRFAHEEELRDCLKQALDAEQKERREHVVLGDDGTPLIAPTENLAFARACVRAAKEDGHSSPCIKVKTITQLQDGQFISEWRDLEEGE